jgi:hypothetical protein
MYVVHCLPKPPENSANQTLRGAPRAVLAHQQLMILLATQTIDTNIQGCQEKI